MFKEVLMDNILQKDREEMEKIASSKNDYPVLMINQNRYREGVESCKSAIKLTPNYGWAYFILGENYRGLKDYDKARTYFEIGL